MRPRPGRGKSGHVRLGPGSCACFRPPVACGPFVPLSPPRREAATAPSSDGTPRREVPVSTVAAIAGSSGGQSLEGGGTSSQEAAAT
eukprot:5938813-Alexandrium_andersonii.AAC.1